MDIELNKFLLSMKDISKSFGNFSALKDAYIEVNRSEIMGLVGENGAGKSTLIKILNGAYSLDNGEIIFDNNLWNVKSPQEAQRLGISTIFQEINLSTYLSITENIFLGREIKNRFGFLNWKLMHNETEKLISSFINEEIDVKIPLELYSTAIKQMVAIARAISFQAKLVVMDEPTSSLDEKEVKILFEIMKKLKNNDVSVLFICHNIDEIMYACDRVTIMRDGKTVDVKYKNKTTKLEIVSGMLGRDLEDVKKMGVTAFNKRVNNNGVNILSAHKLKYGKKVKNVSFDVNSGDIVGLAGLLGSGRTESARLIFGVDKPERGTIKFMDKKINNPLSAIKAGIGFCPEDRKIEGIIPSLSVKDNLTLALLPRLSKAGIIDTKKQDIIVQKYINEVGIKCVSPEQPIKELSGGNQQKVILARWMCMNSKLLILDEPTRGIDVGAKVEIQKIILMLAENGLGVLMVSSELEEIIEGANKVFVLRNGHSVSKYEDQNIIESNIIKVMAGAQNE